MQIIVKSKRKYVFEVQKLRFVITLKNFVDIFRVGETRRPISNVMEYDTFILMGHCILQHIEIRHYNR